ncbi:hypothetical protein OS42_03370 [Dickeya oryzae]
MSSGEDVVDVFFQGPGGTHPPAWHLVDDGVGPQDILHFLFDVVAVIDGGDADLAAFVTQERGGDIRQGTVEFPFGMAEGFSSIDDEYVLHG